MSKKSGPHETAGNHVKDIKRRKFSAEEKIRIVLDGLRGEDGIAELCRRKGIAWELYCTWSKELLEAGSWLLSADTERQASKLPSWPSRSGMPIRPSRLATKNNRSAMA